jgi:hypothetical protein
LEKPANDGVIDGCDDNEVEEDDIEAKDEGDVKWERNFVMIST